MQWNRYEKDFVCGDILRGQVHTAVCGICRLGHRSASSPGIWGPRPTCWFCNVNRTSPRHSYTVVSSRSFVRLYWKSSHTIIRWWFRTTSLAHVDASHCAPCHLNPPSVSYVLPYHLHCSYSSSFLFFPFRVLSLFTTTFLSATLPAILCYRGFFLIFSITTF